jgi:hypothetical protein
VVGGRKGSGSGVGEGEGVGEGSGVGGSGGVSAIVVKFQVYGDCKLFPAISSADVLIVIVYV